MKKGKKLFTLLVAALLVCLLPMTAFAATWDDVDSEAKLQAAFADTEPDVVINLTGDIELADILTANIGQTYTINGHTFVLAHVYLDGAGTVTINADIRDVDGSTQDALHVYDDVNLTVNGNITSTTANDAVETDDNANVTINGSITAEEGDGVDTNDKSKVTVNGDVSSIENEAVYTNEESEVTVNGNVSSAQKEGVDANDDSKVTVNGNVSGDAGVEASGNSKVTVNGNVTGNSGQVGEDGSLDTGDMSDPYGYSDGSAGVVASGNAEVTVTGDVTGGDAYGTYGYAGDGVDARDSSKVTVGGNVKGGSVTADPSVEANVHAVSLAGDGVEMDSTATVTVGGDVTGGTTNGDKGIGGAGVRIRMELVEIGAEDADVPEAGALTVQGTVSGGSGSQNASALLYGNVDSPTNIDLEYIPTDNLINLLNMQFNRLPELCAQRGMTEDEANQYIDQRYDELNEIVSGALANSGTSGGDGIDLAAAIDALPAGQREAARQELFNLYKDIHNDFYGLGEAPEVTVWGLSVEQGADLIGTEGMDEITAQMLASDVNYIIRVAQTTGGTVSVDKQTAKAGETITITPKADEGYELSRVLVSGQEIKAVNGVYTYVVPEGGLVEVSAEFTKTAGGVKTGDDSTVLPLFFLIAGAAAAMFVLLKKRQQA